MTPRDRITAAAFALAAAGLFLERAAASPALSAGLHVLDFLILLFILWETWIELKDSAYPLNYIRTHVGSLLFVAVFTALFLYSKYHACFGGPDSMTGAISTILRNLFLVLKIAGRLRQLVKLTERLALRPAQTVAASFVLVILVGALALMMPFSTSDGRGMGFLDAAFTSTSAVCVTGLVVVDTALDLSRAGQAVLLVLIQVGGLGIMAFSFFAMFALRRKLSVRDRLTVSYMLGEEDMTDLASGLRAIVLTTLAIEGAGAILLLARFAFTEGLTPDSAFRALFHAVSAFCNAGFALYSDSLESFRGDPFVTLSIALLIVLGGLGFGVVRDLRSRLASLARMVLRRGPAPRPMASLNSRVVLALTGVLLLASFGGFYLLEHAGVMAGYGLGEQYLAAAFQAVTLRTAGFNSVPFGSLRDATLLFMIVFMFVGGASGSTAGGIKLNSVAAMFAYFNAFIRQERTARIGASSIEAEKVGKAFLILLFGLCAVCLGTFVLSISEDESFLSLLFEAVSAFGTVGLSTGITPSLSAPGKLAIILLMFLGRLGPLTILSAASRPNEGGNVEFPAGDLAIG